MTGSPIYRDALALAGVLLEEVEGAATASPLARRLVEDALDLQAAICLALGGHERLAALEAADARLCVLRGRLHLALELGLVAEEAFLELVEQGDAVGRQLGGWLKRERRGGAGRDAGRLGGAPGESAGVVAT